MIGVCFPCRAKIEHVWHDNGSPHMVVQCADMTPGYGQSDREIACEAGHCVCQERRPST